MELFLDDYLHYLKVDAKASSTAKNNLLERFPVSAQILINIVDHHHDMVEGLKTLLHRMDNGLIQARVKDAELIKSLLKQLES